jgi:hypothetical protein
MSDTPTEGTVDPAEILAEKQELEHKLEKYEGEKHDKRLNLRKILVGILVVITSLAITVTTIDTWAHRTLLNTDAWVETVAPLGTNPQVTAALATYVTDQIVTKLDLQQRAEAALSQAAPQAAFLAGPITNAIEGFVHDKMTDFFNSSTWETMWTEANRIAHEQAVNILRGHQGTVLTNENGQVTLNLIPVITAVLQKIEDVAQGLLGDRITLPQITSTEQVSDAIAALSSALNKPLPPDFGQIVVFQSDELARAQNAVKTFDRLTYLLVLVSLILIAVTIVLSVNRRRTTVQLAIGAIVGVLIARLIIKKVSNDVVASISSSDKGAVKAVLDDAFGSLRGFTRWLFAIALIVAIVAFLMGKREWLAAARSKAANAYGTGKDMAISDRPFALWIRGHADGLRIAGPIVAVALLFWVGVGWLSVILLGALLVLYELGIRWVAPDVPTPAEPPAV